MINRRNLLKSCGAAASAPFYAEAAPLLPNIVTIMFDDLGYGDCSCYGHPTIITPHIDGMAREGMRFTQFAGSPLCAPSRGQLMTGRLGMRTGLTTNFFPWSEGGIPDSEITVAQMLKKAGYDTMCVGKWHLGHLPRYLPTRHGFDDYFGIPYSNDMSKATNRSDWAARTPPTPLIRGEKIVEQEPDQSMLTQRYTEVAVEFIRKSVRAGRPFFLYVPHTMPHAPIAASSRFRGRSQGGLYGDVVQELDWSVGEILRVLREQKVDRNTLVVMTSDNGPAAAGSAGPLRGNKGTTWEGGMREPGIAWWPGKIPAGVTTPAFATNMDLFPTFVKLAGLEMPTDRAYDGQDLSPVLFHNDPGREPLFFYYRNSPGGPYDREEKLQAVRKGRWKLYVDRPPELCCAVNASAAPPPPEEAELPLLFDVQQDVGERRNQARRQPEVTKELLELIGLHQASFTPAPTER
jgi:arylsulfatase A-like enzyme